jgi:hypothetical protein
MQQKVDMKTKKRVEQVGKLQEKLEVLRTTETNELWKIIIQKRFEVIKISFFVHRIGQERNTNDYTLKLLLCLFPQNSSKYLQK